MKTYAWYAAISLARERYHKLFRTNKGSFRHHTLASPPTESKEFCINAVGGVLVIAPFKTQNTPTNHSQRSAKTKISAGKANAATHRTRDLVFGLIVALILPTDKPAERSNLLAPGNRAVLSSDGLQPVPKPYVIHCRLWPVSKKNIESGSCMF